MAISILTNYSALRAQNSVGKASSELDKSIMQLSTGLRINSASDDPSGFAMAEKLRGEINNLKSTSQGLQSGQTMLNIADSYMTSIISRLGDMSALASQATGSGDRNIIQQEMDSVRNEINLLSNNAEFNGKKLLNGNASAIWASTNEALKVVTNGNNVKNDNYQITLGLANGGNSEYTSMTFTVAGGGTVATTGTSLSALNSFQTPSGNLLSTTQELTIKGSNGRVSTLTLASGDTITNLKNKLEAAMSEIFTAADTTKANMATIAGGNSIKLNTGAFGDQSRLSFSGSSQLLSALGFNETKVGTNQTLTVNVTDGSGNTTTTDTKNGLVKVSDGVSFKFDVNKINAKIDVGTDGRATVNTLAYNTGSVNIQNNALKVYSPSGSSVDLSIGQMDSTSLGLDNISVLNDPMAAKNLIDNAMSKATTLASNMASKMRTVSTMQDSVSVTSENLVAARSRIVDLDMAQATSEFASRQVVLQSATAMLAQANMVPRYALQLLSRM